MLNEKNDVDCRLQIVRVLEAEVPFDLEVSLDQQ